MARKTVDGFKERQRVAAARDLPGVPSGTQGRVIEATGLVWRHYRVDFANGESLNLLDKSDLAPA